MATYAELDAGLGAGERTLAAAVDVDEDRQQRGVLAEGLAVVAVGAPQVIGQEAGQAVAEGVIGIVADELDVDLRPRLAGSLLPH